MNAKKKPVGIKSWIRVMKGRGRRKTTTILLASILLILVLSTHFAYTYLNQSQDQTENQSSELKAAIVDQLSSTFPNQAFRETVTNILEQAAYAVDYYPSKKVTVEFYRNLPTRGYHIVVLRVHSALASENQPPLALFTSELFSTKYPDEQRTDQLRGVAFIPYEPGDPIFFGIPPKFVRLSMNGEFQNTLVIAMGCDSLTYRDMARAFLEKGAKAYIGWNGSVLIGHTDEATANLLRHLVLEGQTVKQAVENTMKEVGVDPLQQRLLTYYPLNAGDQTLEDVSSNW